MQTGKYAANVGSRLKLAWKPGRRHLKSQPSSRIGENPPYGMIGGIEETSASFEARSAPRSYPTEPHRPRVMRRCPRVHRRSVDRGAHRPAIEPRKYPHPGCRRRSADCFMVGTLDGSTEYKRGSRAIARGQWQAPPRIIAWQTTRSRAVCRRARVGQGQAFGGAEEAPSLTLAARDGDGQYAVGAEECSRRGSNKRINKQGRDNMVCTTLCARIGLARICAGGAR